MLTYPVYFVWSVIFQCLKSKQVQSVSHIPIATDSQRVQHSKTVTCELFWRRHLNLNSLVPVGEQEVRILWLRSSVVSGHKYTHVYDNKNITVRKVLWEIIYLYSESHNMRSKTQREKKSFCDWPILIPPFVISI